MQTTAIKATRRAYSTRLTARSVRPKRARTNGAQKALPGHEVHDFAPCSALPTAGGRERTGSLSQEDRDQRPVVEVHARTVDRVDLVPM